MTGRTRYDKAKVKPIIKMLDAAARKYGMKDVKYAANRWVNAQREKASLNKQRALLEKQLSEVSARIKV